MICAPWIILKLRHWAQVIPWMTQFHARRNNAWNGRVRAICTRQLILQYACRLAAAVVIGTWTHLSNYLRRSTNILRSCMKGVAKLFQPTYSVNYVVVGVDTSSYTVRSIFSRYNWTINRNRVTFSYSWPPNHILSLLIHLWRGRHTSLCSSLRKSFSDWTSVFSWCHLASTDVHWRKLYFILGIKLSVLSLFVYKGLFLLAQHAFSLLVAIGNTISSGCILRRWFKCHWLVFRFAREL